MKDKLQHIYTCTDTACFLLIALICRSALNGDLQIGQLLAWYLSDSAQALHKHRCRHGKIKVSLMSDIQMTHSAPLSSGSSSGSS